MTRNQVLRMLLDIGLQRAKRRLRFEQSRNYWFNIHARTWPSCQDIEYDIHAVQTYERHLHYVQTNN